MFKLEDEVLKFADLTIEKMLRSADGEALDVKNAFNCYTADVFSQFAFVEPMGFVEQEGWEPNSGTWTSSFLNTTYMSTSLESPFYCFGCVSRVQVYLWAALCSMNGRFEAQNHVLDRENAFD